jgi:hypothetical protein
MEKWRKKNRDMKGFYIIEYEGVEEYSVTKEITFHLNRMDNSRSPKYVLWYKSKGNRDMGRPKDDFSLILGSRSC